MKSIQTKPIGTSMFSVRGWRLNPQTGNGEHTRPRVLLDAPRVQPSRAQGSPEPLDVFARSMFSARALKTAREARALPIAISVFGFNVALALLLFSSGSALADVHYVDVNSTNAMPPYTNWITAATNIQDAVDAAVAGDEIVVTNGIYATGGGNGNRVTVYKPLTLRSVNGPQFTVIQGFQVPGSTNGEGAIRCVYMANGSSLSGFTLTNGATRGYLAYDYPSHHQSSGGGLWCESTNGVVVSNCVMTCNSAYYYGGGVYSGTLYNCTLIGNSGEYGAVVYDGTLNNCTLTGNKSDYGAAYGSILNNCTVTGTGGGSGANSCTLSNCNLIGNSSHGAEFCKLINCALTGNSGYGAAYSQLNRCTLNGNFGGGASGCTLINCALTGNYNAGGAYACLLTNCTLTGNSANAYYVAGTSYSTLNNCIVYFNSGANYDSYSALNYCCTTPQPANGIGNISSDPRLASATHPSPDSPCRGAGNTAYASGADIDGEAWLNPPSIGCDEYRAGAVTAPLSVAISAAFTNVTVGFKASFTGLIEGLAAASSWDFGDGTAITNQPYTSHAWAAPGDYAVVLRAYNESQPGGISATVIVHVVAQPIYYVAGDSGNPVTPYTSWATAATNIQDAVDAATVAGALVLVTNGTYATGGRAVDGYASNRVVIVKPLEVRSVNGQQATIIDGGQLNRCVYLTNNASMVGFTLSNGGYGAFGGTLSHCILTSNTYGADYCTLNNCTLIGNSGAGADSCTLNNCALTGNGGGAYSSTLNNCTLTGNTYAGAGNCTLNNCTLTGNSAGPGSGGGAYGGALNNCVVYFNTATNDANFSLSQFVAVLNYCCTTPQPTNGVGNITNAPLFVDQASGNLRLQSGSPCINAGNNSYVTNATDLDGNPRISGGIVDIGAYEFQWPQLTIAPSGPNVLLRWPTNNAGYDYTGFTLQSTTNLVSPAVWSTNSPAPVVLGGQNVVTNPISGTQQFFRLSQ